MRVLLLGATGTIGRATARALVAAGHEAVCVVRPGAGAGALPPGTTLVEAGLPGLPAAIERAGAEAVISCLAARTGAPAEARAVDHDAHVAAIGAAERAGTAHFILLSAICVQKPRLAFQQAKLAVERRLAASSLRWSVVRPTAYFKSLSGQVGRVRAGRPFLVFGDGRLTACKPISDGDLARFLVTCLSEPERWNRVLPIGGPGPAITPLEQGRMLCELAGRPVRYRNVPVAMLDAIVAGLSAAGRLSPRLAAKAELARIGRYYATESMLVWDAGAGRYDADATPEYGADTLRAHYAAMLRGEVADDRGDHAVF